MLAIFTVLLCVETFNGLKGVFSIVGVVVVELISVLFAGRGTIAIPPVTEPTPLSVESVDEVLPEAFI